MQEKQSTTRQKVQFYLTEAQFKQLKELSAEENRTFTNMGLTLVLEGMKRREEMRDGKM
ncbi:hypothetical protein [Avibacterium paragallinarum]|uniref:hypothetical protein n=1 Tax=Avibacterium paragallinarum TaxID=728 RepID=UPI00397DFB7D